MDLKTLRHYSHKFGTNFWHIEFATKYCYTMFGKFNQQHLVEVCIRRVYISHHIKIHSISVMPEYVHIHVCLPHNITESCALQLIKGGLAYHFFRNHEKSRLRLFRAHLWSAGGCATTVGYNEYGTVKRYIQNQGIRHAVA